MAFELSRIDRLNRTYSLATLLPAGVPAGVTGVHVALLPPRTGPSAATVWLAATYAAGSFTVLFAGPDADSSGAIVVPGSADLWMKVTALPQVDAVQIERVTVLGGGSVATLPAVYVASVAGLTGAPTAQSLVDALGVPLRAASVASAAAGISVGNAIAVDSSTPIIPLGTGSDWDTGIREIGNVVYDGGLYRMLYSGHAGAYAENTVYVGLATSTDGITWTKQGRLTGITRASEDPYLLRVAGVWHLYVEDKEEVPFRAIRKYHSTDFVTWVDDGQVLTPSAAAWEAKDVSSPTMWVDEAGWHLIYEGRTNSGGAGSTGYATSTDGITWTRHPGNPILSSANVPWAIQVVPDDQFVIGGRRYLTVHTHDGVQWSVALAVAKPGDPSTWRDVFGIDVPVTGLPAGRPGSVMATLTPNDQLLLTLGEASSGGIYRGSFVPANTAAATRFTPAGSVTAKNVQAAIEAVSAATTPAVPGQYMTSLFSLNLYYAPPGGRSATIAPAGTMTLVPLPVGEAVTVTRLGCEVTAAVVGATVRLGIYAANTHGVPTTLIIDAGTVDAAAVGAKEVTVSQVLTPGVYYLGAVAQGGAPTLRAVAGTMFPPTPAFTLADATASAPRPGLFQTGVTGALPATFAAGGVTSAPILVALRA